MEIDKHVIIRHKVIEEITENLHAYSPGNTEFNAYYFDDENKHYRIEVDGDYVSDVHEVPWMGW